MNRALVVRYYGAELNEEQIAKIAVIVSQMVKEEDKNKISIAVFDANNIDNAILNFTPIVQRKDEIVELVNLMKTRLGYTDSKPAITYVFAILDKVKSDNDFLHDFMQVHSVLSKIDETQFANIAKKCNVKKHFIETMYSIGNRIFFNVC
jgi:hypothetical protein|nr:MAG TPA: hypothetical protein [Caudoviricetes sp.]